MIVVMESAVSAPGTAAALPVPALILLENETRLLVFLT